MRARLIKSALALALGLVCQATSSLADEAGTIISYSPVAFYQFNEMANPYPGPVAAVDSMSAYNGTYMTNARNGHNGIAGPLSPAYPGFPSTNKALQTTYNLANSFVGLPGLNIKNNTMTILAWINPTGQNGENSAGIVQSARDAGSGGGSNACGLEYAQTPINGQYALGYNWKNSGYNWHASGLYPPANHWSLVAMVVAPTSTTLYLMNSNAIQSATNIVPANLNANWTTAGTNYIGTDPYSIPGRNFDGCIDDVAFFNYSLSQAQLQIIFAAAYPSPVFSLQPLSQVVFPGQPASFTAAAAGSTPLYYKWQRNGTNLLDQGNVSGSSTATLTITSVSPADTNNYDVVVTNSYGAVTSSVVSLAFTPVPEILSQPVSLEVGAGQTAQLTVSATASVTLSYQWEAGAVGSGVFTNLSDGTNISGSASPTLTITDSGEWNQADYIVVITDSAGQVISRVATLTVGVWEEAGQGGIVSAVAASPDGAWFASGSDDATVKLWRTSDGSVARTLTATGLHQVTSLAFGPPGTNLIAAGYYDGSIRLWNTTNGALVRTFTPCSGKVTSLAFSPTAPQLAVGSGDWLTRILSLSSGAVLNNGGNGSVFNYGVVRSVAYSPDGSMLAVAGEDTNMVKMIFVLDGGSFYLLAVLPQGLNIPPPASAPYSTPFSNSVTSLSFSPDGNTLASGCLDKTISLWSTATWLLQHSLTNAGPGIISLAYAPNGQTLFAGDQGGAIIPWVTSTGLRAYPSWPAHTGPVWSLACSIDGSDLVSGGDDHVVQLWQTANGAWVTNLTSHSAMITKTCFAPDGSLIASAGTDASLRLWTAQTGAPACVLAPHTNQVGALAFSPDAAFLVTGGGCLDNNICLWRSSNGAWLQTIPSLFTNGVTALAVSPDTSLIASAGDRYEQVIKLWNRSTGGLVNTFPGHPNGTAVLAFSPNGQYLASGGMFYSGTIKLWNMASGNCDFTFNGHSFTVVSLSFNPTGTLLASAGQTDGLINIWTNGSVTPLLSLTMSSGARAVAFSPDGALLVAGGSDSIQMWQTSNWQPVWTCTTETVGISALNFSPNGTFLVYGREDGTVGRMWNPQAAPVQLWLGATQPGRFTIANPSYSPFLTVQTSSDLAQWNTLTNLVVATNVVQVADPSPPPVRFYRVSTPQ